MHWDKLSAPTPKEEIKTRPLAGKQIKYIDARFVMDRLDSVVGANNWYFDFDVLCLPKDGHPGAIRGRLSVVDNDSKTITKTDVGEYDVSPMAAIKTGVSDALKRCAVHFGIGRDLYSEAPPTLSDKYHRVIPPEEIKEVLKDVFHESNGSIEKNNTEDKREEYVDKATQNQIKYLKSLSERFAFSIPEDLSKSKASELIKKYSAQ